MYLKGSKWNLTKKRRRRPNPWRIITLVVLIAAVVYINQTVVSVTPPLFIPTPTITRSPESFVNEAKAFFEAGKLSQAISSYQDAIRANPETTANYVSLARVQIFAGQYEEAQKNAELALIRNSENPVAHAVRAWSLDFLGNYLDAEIAVQKALDLDPENALAHAVYAEILIDRGDFGDAEKAIEESRLARELGPNMLETHRARGYVLYQTSNYELAVDELNAALVINNKIPNLHMLLGYCYVAMGEYNLAVEEFNQANALNPSDPIPDLEISRAYFAVGEYARAVQYAQQAVKDDASNPRLHGTLGVMYSRNGERDSAIEQLALAIHGGTTEDGTIVEGIPLDYDLRVIEFYSVYGLSLAREDLCSEAVPIFQAMLTVVPESELAVFNANEGLNICQESLENLDVPSDLTPTP